MANLKAGTSINLGHLRWKVKCCPSNDRDCQKDIVASLEGLSLSKSDVEYQNNHGYE